jgi:hypothetical protein
MSWRAAAVLGLISWSALAFGAVYPWAFIPLFVGCVATGLAGLWRPAGDKPHIRLTASIALLIGAIVLQLAPLPIATIRAISPATDQLLQRFAVGYGTTLRAHPISIQPQATTLALMAVVALAVLFLGLVRTLRAGDARDIANGIGVLGALLAFAGIVQKAMWNGRIYGFWTPLENGESFGPFVNRNHFAGWMLMGLPVAIGYFSARLARPALRTGRGWRPALVALSSDDANKTILAGFAALLMAAGLMLSMSRSGVVGLIVGLSLSAVFLVPRQATRSRKAIAAGFLVLLAVAALWVTGVDRLALRFSERGAAGMGGRMGIWSDSLRIAGQFPAAGTGLNTFGTATLFYQTDDRRMHFSAAHNDYLQLLVEGGALLAIPAVLVTVVLLLNIRRRFREPSSDHEDYWIRIGAVTGILSIAVQEVVDFSLQIPANAVLLVILLALAARHPHRTLPTAP